MPPPHKKRKSPDSEMLAKPTLEQQDTLTFDDVAPLLLRMSSSKFMFLGSTDAASDAEKLKRRNKTTQQNNNGLGEKDILLGRDKFAFSHTGNQRFRVIVNSYRAAYQNAKNRESKTKITTQVIQGIHQCGGRFLKKDEDSGEYVEVSNEVAHEKVSHALRSAKDPKKKGPRKKRDSSSKEPSAKDNVAFLKMYCEQQKKFQQLLLESANTIKIKSDSGFQNVKIPSSLRR